MTRLLIVEDEESFSEALSFMLRREGYEVEIAGDGNLAVEHRLVGAIDVGRAAALHASPRRETRRQYGEGHGL